MAAPHLFTDTGELARIRRNLEEYAWYRASFERFRRDCDTMLHRGFQVPKTCGFVFYNSCKSDNTPLVFDPYDPENHVCPTCGMNYRDLPFHRAWQCYYHQWLSQMSMQLGICYAVTGKEDYAAAVRRIVLDYVRLYPEYENFDNELGPTHVFQSTYIESIWLSYLACGYDLTNAADCYTPEERRAVLNGLFRPSAETIRDYDEKRNNRQAFNNSGLCAAALLTEDGGLLDDALNGPHGFFSHIRESVLSDGLWYEGDNYHFATLPSLVNIAEMCLHNGIDLYGREEHGHSLKGMFEAPLQSLQPDLTFPSRKDSPYASFLPQRWYAGLYELAHTRFDEPAFAKILKVMYAAAPRESGTLKNAAGLMDVFQPVQASRSHLDWRGFLTLTPELGPEEGLPVTSSVCMEGTGLAVLRREPGNHYASLDYGDYGGGHGHPDRLALTFFVRGRRWLTDFGTGQYYFDHLNWYRSTIGHNTLCVDGKTQLPVSGERELFGETSCSAAVQGFVKGVNPGVDARRTIVLLCDGVLFDCMEAYSAEPHRYHNSYHSFGSLRAGTALSPAELDGENYRFLCDIRSGLLHGAAAFVREDGAALRVLPAEKRRIYTASAYGPPSALPARFPVLIEEQEGSGAVFANLLEDVPPGGASLITDFRRTAEGCYRVSLAGGREITVGIQPGSIWILRRGQGRLTAFESYGTAEIPEVVSYGMPLATAEGQLDGSTWVLSLPGVYGSCTLSDSLLGAEKLCVNGRDAAGPCVFQEDARGVRLVDGTLYGGIAGRVAVRLYNFTALPWEGSFDGETLRLSEGLRLLQPVRFSLAPGEQGEAALSLLPELPDGAKGCTAEFPETGSVWSFSVSEPLAVEEWLSYDSAEEAPLKVRIQNLRPEPVRLSVSFRKQPLALAAHESALLSIGLSDPAVSFREGRLTAAYRITSEGKTWERRFEKAAVKPPALPRRIPLDAEPFAPNLFINSASQISRAEKHWGGLADLSGEGMLAVSGGSSLTLRMRVRDDCVLFSGGKFPYDNDGIQLYFDRRPDRYRGADEVLDGVYGLLVCPGASDDAANILPLSKDLQKPEEIAVSVSQTGDGYEVLLDVPFSCVGGPPEPGTAWGFDCIINDRDRGVRRDMQMIWSGALAGERIYLREDSHRPSRFGLLLF